MKAGRISNIERKAILLELGKKVQEQYNMIVKNNTQNYKLDILEDSLQFEPDIQNFNNIFWIDTGDAELTKIAYYFEYGTGLYNEQIRFARNRSYIYPVNSRMFKFRKPWHGISFMDKVAGVHPVAMMAKAIKIIDQNRNYIQRDIREQFYA